MEIFYYSFVFILGGVMAWFMKSAYSKSDSSVLVERNKLVESNLEEAKKQINITTEKVIELTGTLAKTQADLVNAGKMQALLKTEFENLANKLLMTNTQTLADQNQKNISQLLSPLKTQIDDFKSKVEYVYTADTADRAALRTEIKSLAQLNVQMTEDAKNLTLALKGESKSQGDWGEMILERILENSGLISGDNFSVQASLKSGEGLELRPDVIINLPENRHFIIDSKVSLTAYEQYSSTDDKDAKATFLKKHIQSIYSHVDELADKKYHELYQITSPDFVFMFVPIEHALLNAVQEDQTLFNYAFKKNVVLLTPSTLLAILKTVEYMWRQEKQTHNAKEIARKSGALYDKFVGLYADLLDIGKKINSTKDVYDLALNKLKTGKGNIIRSVEEIKKLGAKASKELPSELTQEAIES